jgi:TIR domain
VARVFISHSSRDREQAGRLHDWLRNHGFVEAFLDFDKHAGLAPGSDWERTLYREIAGSEAVILVLRASGASPNSPKARALGKAIFPLIESPRGEDFVSPDIQHINLIEDREEGLDRLSSEVVRIALNARGGFPGTGPARHSRDCSPSTRPMPRSISAATRRCAG